MTQLTQLDERMLVPSTRLKDRLNPDCPNCPILLKKRLEKKQQRDPVSALPGRGNFLKPRSYWDSWDRQAFQ